MKSEEVRIRDNNLIRDWLARYVNKGQIERMALLNKIERSGFAWALVGGITALSSVELGQMFQGICDHDDETDLRSKLKQQCDRCKTDLLHNRFRFNSTCVFQNAFHEVSRHVACDFIELAEGIEANLQEDTPAP